MRDEATTAEMLRSAFPSVPSTAVVIGSGLAALEEALSHPVPVAFGELPGLPAAGVSGHGGRFVHGRLGATEVVVQAGRLHVYEGHPLDVVVAPVRILAALGVETIIMTNAAGGIHPLLEPGDLVLAEDVVNLMFRSPLAGPMVGDEPRFPDMSAPLDSGLRRLVLETAAEVGVRLEQGTYVAVLGPAYETAAEVRMLSRLGADVVGMSTVPEVVTATALGLRTSVLSLVTNMATGLSARELSHDEVLEVGRAAGARVVELVRAVVQRLGADVDGDPRSEEPRSGDPPSGQPQADDPRSGYPGSGDPRSGEAK